MWFVSDEGFFKVHSASSRPRGVGIDLVIVADERTSSSDFIRLAQLSSGAGHLLASIGCIALDQRSAALWSAVRESPFFQGRVPARAGNGTTGAGGELAAAVEAGSASYIVISALHNVELTHLLVAAVTAAEHRSVSLSAFPLGVGGELSLMLPREKWAPPPRGARAPSARSLVESVAAHLLALGLPAAEPEVTKIWVVDRRADERAGATRQPGLAPVLTVVIPTLDASSERTCRLLDSLRSHTTVPFQAVLVDNGNSPQGFTAPVNTALMAARTQYVAVVNDDVQVHEGWWQPLQDALAAGSALVFPHTLEYTRPDFSAWCFALARSTLEELSLPSGEFFDPAFTIWFQDTDLYLRLKERGQAPRYVPESRISHIPSTTVASDDPILKPWIRAQTITDRDRFVGKWGEGILADVGFVDALDPHRATEPL
jgi:hypothetical protein